MMACLALAIGARAHCPEGMEPIVDDDMKMALAIGTEGWQDHAHEACDQFPVWITPEGLKYYETDITPYCTDGNGTYHYTFETINPCKEGGSGKSVGYFEVNTQPEDCAKTWVDNEGLNPQIYVDIEHADNLTAIPTCPVGFELADEEQAAGPATQLLWEMFVDAVPSGAIQHTMEIAEPGWYCTEPGFKRIEFEEVSACLETDPMEGTKPNMIAQGRIKWVCSQQARIRTIAMTAISDYEMTCRWVVDISMGP